MIFGKLWWQAFVFAAVVVAVCAFDVDDECGEGDCSLEMLHLRAKKVQGGNRTRWRRNKNQEVTRDGDGIACRTLQHDVDIA